MSDDQEKLIQQITEHVLAAIANPPLRADIHPPAGVCTGDYSKFQELRGRLAATPPPKNSAGAVPQTRSAVLSGVVTAKQIQQLGSPIVCLAPSARLTPLAVDYIREKRLQIQRADASSAANGNPAANRSTRWLWWIDGHCAVVDEITGQFRAKLDPMSQPSKAAALGDVVRDMARQVRDGRAAGGVLFVHSAAQAACFANRCPSLRAVVGTCGEAAQQGVELLGANALIVEYPHHGSKSMRMIVDQFISAKRPALPQVDQRLKELASCV